VSETVAEGPILGVFAHPDDAEISCGATLAKWAAAGRPVHLLVLTNGDRGSQDPAEDRRDIARTRLEETRKAGELLGLTWARVLDTHDGELENTADVRETVVRAIREIRPTTLVTCDPTAWFFENRYYNHSDHRTAGAIALDAVFPGSGNPHFFAEHLAEGLGAWDVHDVRLTWTLEPNHHEDVTGFIQTKMRALAAHASQVDGDMLGFFEEWIPKEAAEAGAAIGVEHAESFRVLDLS
jgi:LmbE family N-acetylglucosaminyl deacetylase